MSIRNCLNCVHYCDDHGSLNIIITIIIIIIIIIIIVVSNLTVILRGRAGYGLIYITNEAVGRVGYHQLISGKSEKNNFRRVLSGMEVRLAQRLLCRIIGTTVVF